MRRTGHRRAVLRFGLATMLALAAVAAVPTHADATPTPAAAEVAAPSAAAIPDFSDLCNWFRPQGYGYVYWIGGYAIGSQVVVYCHVAYSPTYCESYVVVTFDGGAVWTLGEVSRIWCFS